MIKTNDWQKIYSTYSPKLLGICRRYIQDIHAAEDILQDSFIAAIQNIHQLKDEKMLFAWLKKIVVNNALQYLRKSSKETFITEEPLEIAETSFAMNNSEEKTHVLSYDFTQEELLSSIDNLPNHHKSVFNLYFIENCSHAEIASQLGISVNTSKSHLLRAKKTVQNYLLNMVNSETPKNKKKLTQLLIFCGLGGLLWAQTFKNKFTDFSIPSTRVLEIPAHITYKNINIPLSSGFTRKKGMVTGGITLLIIISSAIIFRPNTQHFFRSNITEKTTETMQEKETFHIPNPNNTISNIEPDYSQNEKLAAEKSHLEKSEIHEEKASSIKLKDSYPIKKDSIEEITPKKVIVVKKIIQRDTIYIER
ncbi:RNA polymerase sigma factor [Chryseobacterium sp. M5A1_1a]